MTLVKALLGFMGKNLTQCPIQPQCNLSYLDHSTFTILAYSYEL